LWVLCGLGSATESKMDYEGVVSVTTDSKLDYEGVVGTATNSKVDYELVVILYCGHQLVKSRLRLSGDVLQYKNTN